MRMRSLLGLLGWIGVLPGAAWAAPFGAYDLQSISMGGVSVASGAEYASFGNPALYATVRRAQDFHLLFPSAHLTLTDPDDVLDNLEDFQDNSGDVAQAKSALQELQGKTVLADSNVAVAAVLTGVEGNAALFLNSYTFVGARPQVAQSDLDALDLGAVPAEYQSRLRISGLSVVEAGVSFAETTQVPQFNLGEIAWGVNLKAVIGKIYEFNEPLTDGDIEATYAEGETTARYNIDVGFAKALGNLWTFGVAVKNLIPATYEGVNKEIKINPQPRIGVARHTRWATFAADLDLIENNRVGFESPTQILGVGAEFMLGRPLRLRLGYSHNIADTRTSLASIGLGLRISALHLDMAAMQGQDSIGAGLQLALAF